MNEYILKFLNFIKGAHQVRKIKKSSNLDNKKSKNRPAKRKESDVELRDPSSDDEV